MCGGALNMVADEVFLRKQLLISYGKDLFERFDFIRVNMALSDFHFGKSAACDIAAAYLKLSRNLFLRKAAAASQLADLATKRFFIRRIQRQHTFRVYFCAVCVDLMRQKSYNCT